jgi:hypothetical protein
LIEQKTKIAVMGCKKAASKAGSSGAKR